MYSGLQTYIFDLDGTLYDFEGKSFSESELGVQVRRRYFEVISENSLGDPGVVYAKLLEKERTEKVGTSQQLAELLSMTRREVLSRIWGHLEPENIVRNYHHSQFVFKQLQKSQKSIFLVTGASRTWALKALQYMELSGYVEQVFGIEDFTESKKDPFLRIQRVTGVSPNNIISVGDQEHTDLVPAKELGMRVLHVKGPQDLIYLL